MANFPSSLPAPLLANYDITPSASFARTQMESGIARQRRRFIARPFDVGVGFILTKAQMQTFVDFYEDTLAGGTAWFTMTLDLGEGVQTYNQVRFKEPYRPKMQSPQLWQVTSTLEVIK